MPRLRHTVEQILSKLREAEVMLSKGQPPAHVCRTLAIIEQTYDRWRQELVKIEEDLPTPRFKHPSCLAVTSLTLTARQV